MCPNFDATLDIIYNSVHYSTRVNWIKHLKQGTRKTRQCLTGHPVNKSPIVTLHST